MKCDVATERWITHKEEKMIVVKFDTKLKCQAKNFRGTDCYHMALHM